jgi:phospholipid transport system substrate-binding protein
VKRRLVHFFAAMISMLALTLGASSAFAGAASDAVKSKQTSLITLIKAGGADSQKKIDAVFDEILDYNALAEASLGTEWAARSDAEKAQFTDLLKQLSRKAYEKNLKKILDFDIDYVGEEAADGGATLVKTKAKKRGGDAREEPLEISFKVVQKGGAWKAVDLVTEGVSLVGSYRSQFTKIIKKDGFPALIQKMKDKLAKGDV